MVRLLCEIVDSLNLIGLWKTVSQHGTDRNTEPISVATRAELPRYALQATPCD